jgi:hypothetical protein
MFCVANTLSDDVMVAPKKITLPYSDVKYKIEKEAGRNNHRDGNMINHFSGLSRHRYLLILVVKVFQYLLYFSFSFWIHKMGDSRIKRESE